LPRVKQLLANGARELPQSAILLELQHVSDPAALPDLISILNRATSDLTRECVLAALSENFNDPRVVPTLAAHLSDPDSYARLYSLTGISRIAHEQACTLPHDWKEQDVEPQISRCKLWWDRAGSFSAGPKTKLGAALFAAI
jgi:HEAT repeat protein